ncbi:MAG: hypothetical protein AAGF67_13115 [Verrucomicrobiota bacterium]
MRALCLIALAVAFSFSLSSCGMVAHQLHRTKNILTAPFRAELEERFKDGVPELERDARISLEA